MRFCAAAPPNENRSLSCGFAATSAVSTNEIATFIAACTRVQYRYKNRAKICTSPQHVPLHLVALKFTHRLPQRCFHCAASQLCIANCHKIALKFTHRRSRSATAVPRYIAPPYRPLPIKRGKYAQTSRSVTPFCHGYIAPPYQLRRRMKIATRLVPLSPRHAAHRITPAPHHQIKSRRRIEMPQIKIALKFTRGLAFGFTLCIVKNHKI